MYVGLDVHKKVCYGTLTDQDGQILKHGRFSNTPPRPENLHGGSRRDEDSNGGRLLLAAPLRPPRGDRLRRKPRTPTQGQGHSRGEGEDGQDRLGDPRPPAQGRASTGELRPTQG